LASDGLLNPQGKAVNPGYTPLPALHISSTCGIKNQDKRTLVATLANNPLLPILAGGVAFLCTLSCTIATVPVVSALVILNRRQWWAISFFSAMGSALAASLIAYLLGNYGYPILSKHLPEIVTSRLWRWTAQWVSQFGFIALFVITALPIPHTPALIFCGLVGMSSPEVFGAFFIGKGVKYSLAAYVTSITANWLSERGNNGSDIKNRVLGRFLWRGK
jgi:membrane protein YqaA with SNARE-associated domain